MSQQSSYVTSCLFCTLAMLLIALPALTSARSLHVADQPSFYQLPGDDDRTISDDSGKNQRLMELLSLRDSMSNLLYPRPELLGGTSGATGKGLIRDGDDNDASDVTGDQLAPPEEKRVFCNGFTGCGGRFREQRRQGPLHNNKRVFCNSQGCFNGGGKRAGPGPTKTVADDLNTEDAADNDLWQEALRRLAQFERTRLRKLSKKLFCNGYGGCQNKGKRQELSSTRPRVETDVGTSLPRLKLVADRESVRGKRYLYADVDRQFDEIGDAIRKE